ncbi:MAG: alkaline phosphatase D family protein [Gammaproteobacteria bacterium]
MDAPDDITRNAEPGRSEDFAEDGSVKDPGRRRLVTGAAALAAASLLPAYGLAGESRGHSREHARGHGHGGAGADDLFSLGVASGDPGARGVVLWTRLAPDPLNGGGMGRRAAGVQWRIARDPDMRRVVKAGEVLARAEDGHAVLVDVRGLDPDRWYYYQFSHRGRRSRIGRTRTFPLPGMRCQRLRFALASCQDFQAGYYAAYRDMLEQRLDFVLHVGDYIYEYAGDPAVPDARRHVGGETITIEDYRNRYAQYRLDADLQNAHAAYPFVVTYDDHEVDNNYAGLVPEDDQDAAAFLARRTAAYKVYRETMPLRRRVRLRAGELSLYRRLRYGNLAQFLVLDSRQYRSDQPCADGLQILQQCPQILDADATMLGAEQEAWMFERLAASRATWNVLAQQVMMMRWDLGAVTGAPVNMFNVDAWDGYQVSRDRVMRFLDDARIANPVVLTGDIHSAWAAELKRDFALADSPTVGAEFVCSSIASTFGDANVPLVQATLPSNPHIRFFDGLHRGYAVCEVTPDQWRTTFRAVQRIADPVFNVPSPELPLFDLAAFGLIAGQPGLNRLL